MGLLKGKITQLKSKFGLDYFLKNISISWKNIGFALGEMMIVLTIVSLVMAAVMPIIIQKQQQEIASQSNVKTANIPAGIIIPFDNKNNTNPPDGWEFCEGKQLNVADEPKLFNVISNRYGGDGVTTFKVPDLRNYFIYGYRGDGSSHALRSTGGAGTYPLAANQLPKHTHNGTTSLNDGHTHTTVAAYSFQYYYSTSNSAYHITAIGTGTTGNENSSHYHTLNINDNTSTPTEGRGVNYNIMPPYYVLSYIIKK